MLDIFRIAKYTLLHSQPMLFNCTAIGCRLLQFRLWFNDRYRLFVFSSFLFSSDAFNIYPHIYIPIEVLTLCILAISNPITLVQLYRRHQRKVALRRASNMLVEMSIKMGSQFAQNSHRQAAVRKASRQQQRILLQVPDTHYLLLNTFINYKHSKLFLFMCHKSFLSQIFNRHYSKNFKFN